MRAATVNLPVEGPGQDDCGRLLRHLQNDYVRHLRLEVGFYELGRAGFGIKLSVVDDSVHSVDGNELVNVWAIKTLGQKVLTISTADIYDLLMTAYRAIDRYFAEGEAFAPARRVK